MPDLDDKYSEFSREIGNDEPTQDNAAGAEKGTAAGFQRQCGSVCGAVRQQNGLDG